MRLESTGGSKKKETERKTKKEKKIAKKSLKISLTNKGPPPAGADGGPSLKEKRYRIKICQDQQREHAKSGHAPEEEN